MSVSEEESVKFPPLLAKMSALSLETWGGHWFDLGLWGWWKPTRWSWLFPVPKQPSTPIGLSWMISSSQQIDMAMASRFVLIYSFPWFSRHKCVLVGVDGLRFRRCLSHLPSFGQFIVNIVILQVAIRSSFKMFWPEITLLGCYFHFSQLIWRRVKGNWFFDILCFHVCDCIAFRCRICQRVWEERPIWPLCPHDLYSSLCTSRSAWWGFTSPMLFRQPSIKYHAKFENLA